MFEGSSNLYGITLNMDYPMERQKAAIILHTLLLTVLAESYTPVSSHYKLLNTVLAIFPTNHFKHNYISYITPIN
jgi:hypothetical protein